MKHKNEHSESGQATMEFAVMLVGLVAVMLGLVFTAGMCLANNRTLLSAKATAERAARSSGATSVSGGEVAGWTRGEVKIGNDTATIPFSAQDRSVGGSSNGGNSIQSAFDVAENGYYSESERYNYEWLSPRKFDSSRFRADFTSSLGNALEAASLVGRTGSDGSPVSDFDRGYDEDVRREMRDAFYYWFGIRIKENSLSENPSNRVYMPIADQKL